MNINTVTQAVLQGGIQFTREGYQNRRSDRHMRKGIKAAFISPSFKRMSEIAVIYIKL